MLNKHKISKLILTLVVIGTIFACRKADDYKKYIEGGEISYPGKLDSVNVMSGDNRVLLKGLFLADPKVVLCKIFWNNFKDSLVIPVNKKNTVDSLSIFVPNVSEGVQSFNIYTYDKAGNRSVAVNKVGISYGDRYKASLSNRGVFSAVKGTDGNATIQWLGMDKLTGVFTTELQYTNSSNTLVTVRTPIDSTRTILKNYKSGSTFKYRTLFLPDTNCIDTFKVAYSANLAVDEDMTSVLSNTGPFNRATWDGSRWGTLAGWTTSAGAKNINNNQYGGYELRSGTGVLSFESGWGINTPVTNGLIYQTITLPAGNYTFRLSGIDQNSGGSRYIAVAAGNTLPDVANIPTDAIAYTNISSGELNFSLTQQTIVSIGFAVSIANTGQYIKVRSVKLLKWAK